MAQKLGFYSLKKRLPSTELNKKIGGLHIKDSAGSSAKRGLTLQKWLTGNLRNKTKGEAKKYLIKYGVQGSQGEKREKILELMFGGSSGSGKKGVKTIDGRGFLTEKQVARNLRRAQRDRIDEIGITREARETGEFAGNVVSTSSISVSDSKKEKSGIGMGRIGINAGQTGFAGGQAGKATIGINSKN